MKMDADRFGFTFGYIRSLDEQNKKLYPDTVLAKTKIQRNNNINKIGRI